MTAEDEKLERDVAVRPDDRRLCACAVDDQMVAVCAHVPLITASICPSVYINTGPGTL